MENAAKAARAAEKQPVIHPLHRNHSKMVMKRASMCRTSTSYHKHADRNYMHHVANIERTQEVKEPMEISSYLGNFQQTPGTYPRYPKIQIRKVVEGLGSHVPGVCWSFLRAN